MKAFVPFLISLGLLSVAAVSLLNGGTQATTVLGATSHVGETPMPSLTPGATNSNITAADVKDTLCNPHWTTKSIRPSVGYTNALKLKQMKAYGYPDASSTTEFEEDHLISLQLGGSPTNPENLWPEPYVRVRSGTDVGARVKDQVENLLHRDLCSGKRSLQEVQQIISTDWTQILPLLPHGFGAAGPADLDDEDASK